VEVLAAHDDRAGEQTGVVVDADGHVFEDVDGIVEHLAEPYRSLRAGEAAQVAGQARVFPPLGHLSSTPFRQSFREGNEGAAVDGFEPDGWVRFLDAVGISATVLYPTLGLTIGSVRDLDYAAAVCRAYNDWLAETYLRHPSNRFRAAALLPLQDPAAAAEELRRAVVELGFSAGVLPANGLSNHLGDERYHPVYAAADELDVGLACHGGDGHLGLGLDDVNVFAAVHALGHPFSLLRALGAMLCNGVFERFPRLRVAYLEGGAAWTLLAAERLSESFAAMPPPESNRLLSLPAGRTLGDHLAGLVQSHRVVFGCEGGEEQLEHAIARFGGVPFMYSSDFPHEVSVDSCAHELGELDELPVALEAKALLRGGTASRFYRLSSR
jgi:predicted TIM-barrel fold metal-dependent hydrolase